MTPKHLLQALFFCPNLVECVTFQLVSHITTAKLTLEAHVKGTIFIIHNYIVDTFSIGPKVNGLNHSYRFLRRVRVATWEKCHTNRSFVFSSDFTNELMGEGCPPVLMGKTIRLALGFYIDISFPVKICSSRT